jgi:hypothetical protein
LRGLACGKNSLVTVGYYSEKYGDLQMWTADTAEMTQSFFGVDPGTANHVTIDRSGQHAATVGDIRYVLWSVTDNQVQPLGKIYLGVSEGHDVEPRAVDFSPSGEFVALARSVLRGYQGAEGYRRNRCIWENTDNPSC